MTATFADWQPRYAAHGVALFPVRIVDGTKKPAITGYLRTGLNGSEQLAMKFGEAASFGFACGRRNRLTVLDMDSQDESILIEGERLFGPSPLVWRTGGGKFAAAYRHNREARRIRPIPGLPIDLLGAGFCVAPPSAGAARPYEIIRGTLDDLDQLPTARIPDEIARDLVKSTTPRADKIHEGLRGAEIFAYARRLVDYCDTFEQLLDAVNTWAGDHIDMIGRTHPITTAEIARICRSVWTYRGGRKRVMNLIIEPEHFKELATSPDIFGVFAFLAAENGPDAQFLIADGLGETMGWPRRLVPAARARLLELGFIKRTGRMGRTGPYLYRWSLTEAAQPQTSPNSRGER